MTIAHSKTELKEDELLQIPRYLPLRNYQAIESSYKIDLGAGLSYFSITLGEEAFQLLLHFVEPSTPRQAALQLNFPIEQVLDVCAELVKGKILKKSVSTPEKFKRYDRHLLYYSLNSLDSILAQTKLSQCSVALIGMGGIGNWVSLNLIGLGLKKLRLIDPDIIEKTNLTRQLLFGEKDIGLKKVDVAEKILKEKNSETEIEKIDLSVTESNIETFVQDMDFVVLSADSPVHFIQKWVNQACVRKKIPFFNVGYSDGLGVIGPLVVPGKTACMACDGFFKTNHYLLDFGSKSEKLDKLFKRYQAPSFGCLNSLVSSMAAYEIVKYFTLMGDCLSLNRRIYVNPITFSLEKRVYTKIESCEVCGSCTD